MKYQLTVNGKYPFEMDEQTLENYDAVTLHNGEKHVLYENKKYRVFLDKVRLNDKYFEVLVNGNRYRVEIKGSLDKLIDEMGLDKAAAHKEAHIKSPMPGLILDILVREGDTVEEGDTLLILEAMKMENAITAPVAGTVSKIHIEKAEAVEKGVVLVEIE